MFGKVLVAKMSSMYKRHFWLIQRKCSILFVLNFSCVTPVLCMSSFTTSMNHLCGLFLFPFYLAAPPSSIPPLHMSKPLQPFLSTVPDLSCPSDTHIYNPVPYNHSQKTLSIFSLASYLFVRARLQSIHHSWFTTIL